MGPPATSRRMPQLWLLQPIINLLSGAVSGVIVAILMLGVLCARVFGVGPPQSHDVSDKKTSGNAETTVKEEKTTLDDLLTDEAASTPAQARIAAFRHAESEEIDSDQATAVRPTPPGQTFFIGQPGPTPYTPPPAHPSSLNDPARCTSDPPSPASLLPRNLDATLLAVAQACNDDCYGNTPQAVEEVQTPDTRSSKNTGLLGLANSTCKLWPQDLHFNAGVPGSTGADLSLEKQQPEGAKTSLWEMSQTHIAMTVPRPPATAAAVAAAVAAAGDSPTVANASRQQPQPATALFDQHEECLLEVAATPIAASGAGFGFKAQELGATHEACTPAAAAPLVPVGLAGPEKAETVWRRTGLHASEQHLDADPGADSQGAGDRASGMESLATALLQAYTAAEGEAPSGSDPVTEQQVPAAHPSADGPPGAVLLQAAPGQRAPGGGSSRQKVTRSGSSCAAAAPGRASTPRAASAAAPPTSPGQRRFVPAPSSRGSGVAVSPRSAPRDSAPAVSPRGGSKAAPGTNPAPVSPRRAPNGAPQKGLTSPSAVRPSLHGLKSESGTATSGAAPSYAAPTAASKARRSLHPGPGSGMAGAGASTPLPLDSQGSRTRMHKSEALVAGAGAAEAGGGAGAVTPHRGSRSAVGAPRVG